MGAVKQKTLSRDLIAQRILAGETLIIYRGTVLRIPPSWLASHPGGTIALLHFVGRDASDEIDALHCQETVSRLKHYSIGALEHTEVGWTSLVPPYASGWVRKPKNGKLSWHKEFPRSQQHHEHPSIFLVQNDDPLLRTLGPTLSTLLPPPTQLSPKAQAQHSAAFKTLHQRVINAGLYKTPYLTGYGPEIMRYILLASLSVYAYKNAWFLTSALFLGLTWHQLVFTVHDLGHMGVTHNWTQDRVIATLLANFIGGLSIGWWVDSHNVHHIVTNHPLHDPDIQHLPFFAVTTEFFDSLWSTYHKRVMEFDRFAKFMVAIQHKVFYVAMAVARFNLYVQSYIYLYKKASDTRRTHGAGWSWGLELAGVVFFWAWYWAVLRGCGSWQVALGYLLISNITPSPLHVQIVLSHFSMSTEDLGPTESFPHRQLRTTTDVRCDESVGFLHGGLHLQVTHHLFPRLPRHNLRAASLLVKEFAKEEGLTYFEFGFVDANKEVIGVLKNVAMQLRAVVEQVKVVGMVADAEVHEAIELSRKGKPTASITGRNAAEEAIGALGRVNGC